MILKNAFRAFVEQSAEKDRAYHTLGPEGTSSRQAADVLASRFPARIELFATYEAAAATIDDDPANRALIVANAYSGINKFYISHDLIPAAAFFNDTPPYVIAARSLDVFERGSITVASHPAPRHLIETTLSHPSIEVLETDSTHRAAELVANDRADACLTTQIAADMMGLKLMATACTAIPMLWTIFINKDHETWKKKALLSYRKSFPSDSKPTLRL